MLIMTGAGESGVEHALQTSKTVSRTALATLQLCACEKTNDCAEDRELDAVWTLECAPFDFVCQSQPDSRISDEFATQSVRLYIDNYSAITIAIQREREHTKSEFKGHAPMSRENATQCGNPRKSKATHSEGITTKKDAHIHIRGVNIYARSTQRDNRDHSTQKQSHAKGMGLQNVVCL